jgi:6-phosphogluconolactonase
MLVYVANADSLDIRIFRLDPESGALTQLAAVPVPEIVEPSPISLPLALSPDRRLLYAAIRSEPFAVKSFRRRPDGSGLDYLGTAPLPAGMAYVATDRSGRFLFGASYTGNLVSVSPIDGDGRAGPAQQVIELPGRGHAVLPDPTNRHVFVTVLGADCVRRFAFDSASGRLSPGEDVAIRPGAAPRHFVFRPDGRGSISSTSATRPSTSSTSRPRAAA